MYLLHRNITFKRQSHAVHSSGYYTHEVIVTHGIAALRDALKINVSQSAMWQGAM